MNIERISCDEARERLPLYVGADLDDDVLRAVHRHLEGCVDCARRVASAMEAREELFDAFQARQAELGGIRPGLWPGIRDVLRAEGLVHEPLEVLALPSVPERQRRRRWAWALAPVAAAAALVLMTQLGGVFGGPNGSNLLPSPQHAPTLPRGAEVVFTNVSKPAVEAHGLSRIPPQEVSPLRPFPTPKSGPAGGASLAGFRGRPVR